MTAFDLLIRGGGPGDVGVRDGLIAAVGPELEGGAREELDARGLELLPGVVDAHVHLNEPGRAEWEGFATGTAALAAGGATTAVDMPLNAHPPTLDGAAFDRKRACGEAAARVDFALWGGLVPGNLEAMDELAARGVVGYKAFMADSGIDDFAGGRRPHALRGHAPRGGARAAGRRPRREPRDHLGPARARGGRGAHGACATGSIPAPRSPRPRRSRARSTSPRRPGARCTSSTSPPAAASRWWPRRGRAAPTSRARPARTTWCSARRTPSASARSRSARRRCARPPSARRCGRALEGGELPMVASDHSPSPPQLKEGDVLHAWGGIAGAQTTLPLVLGEGRLTRERIAEVVAGFPARRLGLAGKGRLEPGADADLVLVDRAARDELRAEDLHQRHRSRRSSGGRCAPASCARSCAGGPCSRTGGSWASRAAGW